MRSSCASSAKGRAGERGRHLEATGEHGAGKHGALPAHAEAVVDCEQEGPTRPPRLRRHGRHQRVYQRGHALRLTRPRALTAACASISQGGGAGGVQDAAGSLGALLAF